MVYRETDVRVLCDPLEMFLYEAWKAQNSKLVQ